MKSNLDFTPKERKTYDDKLIELKNVLDEFLKDIRETIEQRGEK